MSNDLVKRLRGKYASPQDVAEAVDCINDLWARKEVLEKALRPFAILANQYDPPDGDDDDQAWSVIARPTIGSLRIARDALEGKDDK